MTSAMLGCVFEGKDVRIGAGMPMPLTRCRHEAVYLCSRRPTPGTLNIQLETRNPEAETRNPKH